MIRVGVVLTLLASLCSCGRDTAVSDSRTPEPVTAIQSAHQPGNRADSEALETQSTRLWDATGSQLAQLSRNCRQFETSIGQLLETPTDETLLTAQQQWRQLHGELRTLAIATSLAATNPGLFSPLAQSLANIDQQPIAAGYLDSVAGYPNSGLVNDITLDINHSNVRQQHGLTADNEASLGLHPLEFILFAETGQRGAGDFVRQTTSTPELASLNRPQNRRRDYLALTTKLLCDDSEQLAEQWREPQSAIAAPYFALTPEARLQLWQSALQTELQALHKPRAAHHCDFAPKGCDIHWRYRGLFEFIERAEPAVPALPANQRAAWQSGVTKLQQALASEPRNDQLSQQAIAELNQAINGRD